MAADVAQTLAHSGDLIDRARAQSGLPAFADDSFREGLDRLLLALRGEARLNAMGAMALEMQIVDLLVKRLEVDDWYRRYPQIDEEAIVAPLIGLGLPRTGSTALACLLGEDKAARSLRTWESMAPCPPPHADPASVAPRLAAAEASMVRRAALFPRMVQMLPSSATSPTECQLFMAQDFKSQIFQAFANIPSYVEWLECEADLKPTYQQLKRVLKLLQWRAPKLQQWRIKNPAHSLFIDDLDAVFPDARFVMTHREIGEVIPSVADVYWELSQAYSDHVDPPALAAMNVSTWQRAMQRMIAFRDAGAEPRFFDVAFAQFMRDPMPQLDLLYAWLGQDLTTETRAAMQAWRAANAREKHGRHEIDLALFAIDLDRLAADFAFYRQRFPAMFPARGG